MGSDLPIYEVRPERGKGPSRVLHRNLLMSCDYLPFEAQPELNTNDKRKQKERYQPKSQIQESDEDSGDEYELHYVQPPTVPIERNKSFVKTERNVECRHPPVEEREMKCQLPLHYQYSLLEENSWKSPMHLLEICLKRIHCPPLPHQVLLNLKSRITSCHEEKDVRQDV